MDAYKSLVERRLLEFDPKHPLPVLPSHLGNALPAKDQVEIKRQLAIKEQDLLYSKQRNEKLHLELESLKKDQQKELESLRSQLAMTGSDSKLAERVK